MRNVMITLAPFALLVAVAVTARLLRRWIQWRTERATIYSLPPHTYQPYFSEHRGEICGLCHQDQPHRNHRAAQTVRE